MHQVLEVWYSGPALARCLDSAGNLTPKQRRLSIAAAPAGEVYRVCRWARFAKPRDLRKKEYAVSAARCYTSGYTTGHNLRGVGLARRCGRFGKMLRGGRTQRTMDRQQLLQRLDKAWTALKESYVGLPDAQLTVSGVTGEWSVRDILVHITTWEEEALQHLPHIVQGGRPPRYSVQYGGIDAFNALMMEQKRGLALADVRKQMDETHARLVAYLHNVPEALFTQETRFRRRLRLDTYSHYPLHTKAILAWRARL